MLNRLLGSGTYVSYDMRCMVTGQFAVGKSSLVKLLAGDVVPEGRHPTDGISLIEGRCGLDVETRSWIYIDPGKKIYNIKTFHLSLNTSLVSSTSLLASESGNLYNLKRQRHRKNLRLIERIKR